MTPVVAVLTRMVSMVPLTTMLGTGYATRIVNQHYDQKPQLPAVLAFEVDSFSRQLLRGPDGLSRSRVQTEVRADSKPVADSIAAAVHGDGLGEDASGLMGFIGPIGSPSFDIVNVEPAGRRSGYDADELRQYWVQQDYIVVSRGIA